MELSHHLLLIAYITSLIIITTSLGGEEYIKVLRRGALVQPTRGVVLIEDIVDVSISLEELNVIQADKEVYESWFNNITCIVQNITATSLGTITQEITMFYKESTTNWS